MLDTQRVDREDKSPLNIGNKVIFNLSEIADNVAKILPQRGADMPKGKFEFTKKNQETGFGDITLRERNGNSIVIVNNVRIIDEQEIGHSKYLIVIDGKEQKLLILNGEGSYTSEGFEQIIRNLFYGEPMIELTEKLVSRESLGIQTPDDRKELEPFRYIGKKAGMLYGENFFGIEFSGDKLRVQKLQHYDSSKFI